MDRHEARDNKVIEELVSSAERGVEVELTRDGRVVARVVPVTEPPAHLEWRKELEALHASLPPAVFKIDWQNALQESREGRSFEGFSGYERAGRSGDAGTRLDRKE
jgi:antitoxin (DNA-binding transcriptional repressor) of toxin-antitoxin stability system